MASDSITSEVDTWKTCIYIKNCVLFVYMGIQYISSYQTINLHCGYAEAKRKDQ